MKQHATTIVLGVLCAFFAIWLLVDRDKVTDTERKRRESSVFPAWRRDDLTRIEITKGLERLVLVRDTKKDSTWSMTSPRAERTDFASVEKLITTLEFATVARKVGEGDLGFDAPRAQGTVEMGGLSFRFTLGGASPRPEGSSYFRVGSDPPVVIGKELTDLLLASADTYRTRSVVPYLSTELSKIETKDGFVLTRADDRLFTVGGLLASREEVDKIWTALAELRAETFPKDADAERLTADPSLVVVMTPKDPKQPPGEIRIGAECPGEPNDVVVLRTAPTRLVACSPKGAAETLKRAPEALAMRRPFSLRGDEIEELRLERIATDEASPAPRAIELARKGGGFYQREPASRELPGPEAEAAIALVSAIEHLNGGMPVARAGRPFEAAYRARVRGGDREEIVEIGALEGNKALLHRLKDDALLEVSRVDALALVPRDTSLKPRLFVGDTRAVKRVILRCGVAQELADKGSGLRLVEPAGYETDGAITQLVDAFTRGKIDRWVADDGAFGVTDEACRVVLAFEDGNAPVTVRFGTEEGTNVYGKIDGSTHVFTVGTAILGFMRTIFVSRATLRVEAARIESVRVTSNGRVVKNPLALRDAVSSLIAERVIELGEPEIPVEMTIDVTLAEGGPPKRITCTAPDKENRRKCVTPGTRAVFLVGQSRWSRFFEAPEGGNVARDAGSR